MTEENDKVCPLCDHLPDEVKVSQDRFLDIFVSFNGTTEKEERILNCSCECHSS